MSAPQITSMPMLPTDDRFVIRGNTNVNGPLVTLLFSSHDHTRCEYVPYNSRASSVIFTSALQDLIPEPFLLDFVDWLTDRIQNLSLAVEHKSVGVLRGDIAIAKGLEELVRRRAKLKYVLDEIGRTS